MTILDPFILISFFRYDVITTDTKTSWIYRHWIISDCFVFLVLVKTKRAFPLLQPNSFIRRKSGIRKRKNLTCLINWLFAKLSLIFLCSDDENCDECGDYVRHVFSFVSGSLAAISLLVVLLFHASKTICKESGEICYCDIFGVIVIIIFWEKNVLLCVGHLIKKWGRLQSEFRVKKKLLNFYSFVRAANRVK